MYGQPVMIDAFCCAGGAGMGWFRAGFRVIGIDKDPQPNYPFEFHRADALEWVADNWRRVRAVAGHFSPPCQRNSPLTNGTNKARGWGEGEGHVDLIPDTRKLAESMDIPTVIENVQGSDLRRDMILCGELFGLRVLKRRYFELRGFEYSQELRCPGNSHHKRTAGWRHGVKVQGHYFQVHGDGGGKGSVSDWQNAMGMHWTRDRRELAEAIPPAYTEYIGRQLLKSL